jgi:diguanylate cyclase (GGDEF)-like protein/PAS domain S-box-containing protein
MPTLHDPGKPVCGTLARRREHFFQQLVSCSLDIVTIVDEKSFIRYESQATEELLGYPPEELIGRCAFDFIHPDDCPSALVAFQNVISEPGRTASADFRFRHSDGSWRYLAAVARNLLHESDIAGVIVNSRDVTSQKLAEIALSESEERFRQLTENIDEVFWISDPSSSTMYYVSPAYEKLWGRTCESLMKSPRSFLDAVHPDDRDELLAMLAKNQLGEPYSIEYRIRRPDGTERWISDRGFPVYDRNGVLCRCAGIAADITRRRTRAEQLNKLMLAVDQSPAAVVITDVQGTIEFVNPKFTEITGYSATEAVSNNARLLKSGKHDEAFYSEFWKTILTGRHWHGEFCNKKKDGSLYWESASVSAVRNERNEITNFVAVKEDITAKVRDQEQLRLQSTALSAAANSIFITDRHGRVIWANRAFCELSGFHLDELIGQTPRILKSGKHGQDFYEELWQTILARRVWSGEVIERKKNGDLFTVHQTITPLADSEGQITHFIAVHEDITARKDAELRIERMAYHDALTGLWNRTELQNRLQQAVDRAGRSSSMLALHFIDLDRFKVVNDTLGHDVGDSLLKAVAERLQGCLRASDTAARIGGDEFAVLQPDIAAIDGAATLAGRVIDAMAQPFRISNRDIHISPSIGISIFPSDSGQPEELLKNADMAMYLAKNEGRNNFQFFTSALNAELRDRLALESELHVALDARQFVLHFQPQFDLRTRRLTGMEALIRWQHPTRGLLPPSKFVPVAEECGFIHAMSRWVLEEACSQNASWHAAGFVQHRMAVNISSMNFKHEDFCELIEDILEQSGLAAKYLELEITETLLLQDWHVMKAVPALKKMGVMLSIDDFGTGYSSLSYLRRLPVEKLKIDQSFVRGIPDIQDDAIIARAIVDLGHALGHTVIAEGIESEQQLAYLRDHGCDEGQGYLFGKPMPAEEFEELLEQESALASFDLAAL